MKKFMLVALVIAWLPAKVLMGAEVAVPVFVASMVGGAPCCVTTLFCGMTCWKMHKQGLSCSEAFDQTCVITPQSSVFVTQTVKVQPTQHVTPGSLAQAPQPPTTSDPRSVGLEMVSVVPSPSARTPAQQPPQKDSAAASLPLFVSMSRVPGVFPVR